MRKITYANLWGEKQQCYQVDMGKSHAGCIECVLVTLNECFMQQQMEVLHASFLPPKIKDVQMEIWQQRLNTSCGHHHRTRTE